MCSENCQKQFKEKMRRFSEEIRLKFLEESRNRFQREPHNPVMNYEKNSKSSNGIILCEFWPDRGGVATANPRRYAGYIAVPAGIIVRISGEFFMQCLPTNPNCKLREVFPVFNQELHPKLVLEFLLFTRFLLGFLQRFFPIFFKFFRHSSLPDIPSGILSVIPPGSLVATREIYSGAPLEISQGVPPGIILGRTQRRFSEMSSRKELF